jgi:hypothetical protein
MLYIDVTHHSGGFNIGVNSMRILLIFLTILLSSCVSPAEMEERKKQYCANLGAAEGSPNYYHCRQSLERRIIERDERINAQIRESMKPQPVHMPPMQSWTPANQMRCRSYQMAGSVHTDCN